MEARRDAAGIAIPGSAVEHMRAVPRRDHCSVGFKSASTLVRDVYGDTVDDVVTAFAGSSVSSLIEDDDNWNFGAFPLSRNFDLCTSFSVDLMAIQTRCRKLSLADPEKASAVLGLALQGLEALQELNDTRKRVLTL